MSTTAKHVKCVVVGDNGAGKTTLLIRYTTASFCPPEEVPTIFDNYTIKVRVRDEYYDLALWDTYKPEEHDRLRALSYPGTDVLLVCFSVISRHSFNNVGCFWLSEIQHFLPSVPWLLIGTRIDQRGQYDTVNNIPWNRPVTTGEAIRKAKRLGAFKYIECSSLERINVDEVFEQVSNRGF
ncbi:unnamed protein product [Penicillium egyptiacum]|uniref:Uncharacterized protein n=1 Tax=Penicillium egyptiacum TaxID=1303716 RepID=A0A9W4KMN5_9EURO|nr:unnamed protein product [Penicillium egyptiacum]